MTFKHTLKSRVVVGFFLLTLALCGAFAGVVFLVIHGLEQDLFYSQLERKVEWLIQSTKNGTNPTPPPGTQVYTVKGNRTSGLPDFLKEIQTDQAEIELDDEAYHVVVRQEGDTRYYLVLDQTQFENLEDSVGATIAIGLVVALAGSVWLGYFTANRIIAPVIELSQRVKKADRDETQLKNLAEHFSKDEVGLLAATFSQYAEKIQDFLKREKLFTGDVSHELRTPLMVISSSCELLLETSANDSKQIAIIQRIHRSSQEMRSLVDTFLTLSRENTNPTNQFSLFSAGELIAEAIEEIRKTAEGNGVATLLKENSPLQIHGVPQLFRVVIKNLLRNAVQNTRQGTITVTLNSDSIHVEDTGRGIPKEFQNVIFNRHYRISSLDDADYGEGLGLSIVKRICDYHEWKIKCEAVEPQGCCFILQLPSSP